MLVFLNSGIQYQYKTHKTLIYLLIETSKEIVSKYSTIGISREIAIEVMTSFFQCYLPYNNFMEILLIYSHTTKLCKAVSLPIHVMRHVFALCIPLSWDLVDISK